MIPNGPSTKRRVLCVMRHPVGGIRTYLLYNYPHLIERGYRFTFVGPADAAFRQLADELRDWPEAKFFEAPVAGFKCKLRRTVASCLAQRRFDLIHSQGLTAAGHGVLANLRYGVPHIITSHDVIRANQFRGVFGRIKRTLPQRCRFFQAARS